MCKFKNSLRIHPTTTVRLFLHLRAANLFRAVLIAFPISIAACSPQEPPRFSATEPVARSSSQKITMETLKLVPISEISPTYDFEITLMNSGAICYGEKLLPISWSRLLSEIRTTHDLNGVYHRFSLVINVSNESAPVDPQALYEALQSAKKVISTAGAEYEKTGEIFIQVSKVEEVR